MSFRTETSKNCASQSGRSHTAIAAKGAEASTPNDHLVTGHDLPNPVPVLNARVETASNRQERSLFSILGSSYTRGEPSRGYGELSKGGRSVGSGCND